MAIDRSMIDPAKLLDLILSDCAGNINPWWRRIEFVRDYMPPYPRPDTQPTRLSIRVTGTKQFLRDVGHGVFIWDFHYGEDSEFRTPEHAILALMKAPVPPFLLKREAWEAEANHDPPRTTSHCGDGGDDGGCGDSGTSL